MIAPTSVPEATTSDRTLMAAADRVIASGSDAALSPTPAALKTKLRIGLLILAALYLLQLGPMPMWPAFGDDGSVYLITAKALAAGRGYRLLNLPGEPVATLYPIGYPALLALIFRVAPFGPVAIA